MSDTEVAVKHDCNMCNSGEIGRLFSRDIILSRKTPQEAMAMFKMPYNDVIDHINNHEIVIDEDSGNYESPDFYINEVLKSLKAVKDWIRYCQLSSSKTSKEDIEVFIKLNKELRETLKCLGEFHGRLGHAGSVTINVETLNQKYLAITNILQTEVCPECQLRVLRAMEELEDPNSQKMFPSISTP